MELDKNVVAAINTALRDLAAIYDLIGIISESSTKVEICNVIHNLRIVAELLNNTEKTDETCIPKVLPIMKT